MSVPEKFTTTLEEISNWNFFDKMCEFYEVKPKTPETCIRLLEMHCTPEIFQEITLHLRNNVFPPHEELLYILNREIIMDLYGDKIDKHNPDQFDYFHPKILGDRWRPSYAINPRNKDSLLYDKIPIDVRLTI